METQIEVDDAYKPNDTIVCKKWCLLRRHELLMIGCRSHCCPLTVLDRSLVPFSSRPLQHLAHRVPLKRVNNIFCLGFLLDRSSRRNVPTVP